MKKFVIIFLSCFMLMAGTAFAFSFVTNYIPNYCSKCGSKLETTDLELKEDKVIVTCHNCGSVDEFILEDVTNEKESVD